MGYRLRWPKKNLTHCPGWVDHYMIYPKTETFSQPLAVFSFPKSPDLRLWVLPFCLSTRQMHLPQCGSLAPFFSSVT